MKKFLFISLSVFLLSGCSIFEEEYAEKYGSGSYDLIVSPQEIFDTYNNNVLDGNKKYAEKRLKVTSTYKSISNDSFLGTTLYLDKVHCNSFNTKEDVKKLSELNKGQTVTVIGTAYKWLDVSLTLEDCEIYEY